MIRRLIVLLSNVLLISNTLNEVVEDVEELKNRSIVAKDDTIDIVTEDGVTKVGVNLLEGVISGEGGVHFDGDFAGYCDWPPEEGYDSDE